MSDSEATVVSVSAVVLGLILVGLMLATGSCTINPDDASRILKGEGVQDIRLGGYSWFGCSDDDWFNVKFEGTRRGTPVSGVLCQGMLKATTVRYR